MTAAMPPPRDILEALQEMPIHVQKEAFFFLRSQQIRYTENKNGVFFNLTNAPADIWPRLHHLLCKEAIVRRESEERETCLRQLQESLQREATRPEEPVEAPGDSAAPPGDAQKTAAPPSKGRDILSMLRKKAAEGK